MIEILKAVLFGIVEAKISGMSKEEFIRECEKYF